MHCFYFLFSSLLRIRTLCTFVRASRSFYQHQLRPHTPVWYSLSSAFQTKSRARQTGREAVTETEDFQSSPVLSCPPIKSLSVPNSRSNTARESNAALGRNFQSISAAWGTYTALQSPVLGTPQLSGPQPIHPQGQNQAAFLIWVPSDQIISVMCIQRGVSPARLLPSRAM